MKHILPQVLFFPLIFISLLSIGGCASVVSSSGPPTRIFQLQNVQVVWKNNPSLRYIIKKQSKHYDQIDEKDKKRAKDTINQLTTAFQKGIVTKTKEHLASLNVSSGDSVILELTPVYASYNTGGGRSLQVQAKIKESQTQTLWWVIIRVNGSPQLEYYEFVNNFAEKLMEELKKVGWVNSAK